ncbi:MAG: dynamin family protein, partial [Deltaproteobacteria bacterium]|nr:dynamin family protein [Deltaproteobacteria bacterium]
MDYSLLKQDLLQSLQDIKSTFVQAESIPGLSVRAFSVWKTSCETIRRQLSGEIIRVAVVGSIKSGKSTFVNSLIGADHLKRGAGVVTSFVTKLRSGPFLRARLIFKSWDDVNADVAQALVLLPEFRFFDEKRTFDIRRVEDRDRLEKSLALLGPDQLVVDGTRNANSLLLGAYLQGFDRVREILSSEDLTLIYGPERFTEHRSFVGNDALSVYLKDIHLGVDSPILDDYVEIADCQGSDSPNPLHLAMIQDYLHLTHLIVYVISSRTGLRQADIKFLSLIKQMGIMDNMLFVVNCDFNEHESRIDLDRLVEKVREELSYIKPDSEVFTLSALLNLFRSEKKLLGQKDSNRLQQWEQDQELKALSDAQTKEFAATFHAKVNQERYALLLENQLERIRVMVAEIARWIDVNREVLKQDADQIKAIVLRLNDHQQRLGQIRSMVNQTLDGALNQIKIALKREVDRLFNDRSEGVLVQVNDFINNFDLNTTAHESHLREVGFTQTLYLIFQEFKQALNMHLAEMVKPKVIRFIRGQEAAI